MKRSIGKIIALTVAAFAAFSAHTSPGAPVKITPPDCGLIAAIDSQSTNVGEGIVVGDFEAWYPGLYPDYTWARETAAVTTNGLFQMNYAVLDRHKRTHDQLSVLVFRPEFRPSIATGLPISGADAKDRLRIGQAKPPVSAQAVHEIEKTLLAAQRFQANRPLYAFVGFAEGLSFVSRVPARVAASSSDRGLPVLRVGIFLERGRGGLHDLVMQHVPMLFGTNGIPAERIVLAENVSLFHLEYWDPATASWQAQSGTNMPPMVRVTVGTGNLHPTSGAPQELTSRIVALPAAGVPTSMQRGGPGGQPGRESPHAMTKFSREATASLLGKPGGNPAANVRRAPKDSLAVERQLHWLGRSGVELAKVILAADLAGPSGQIDSLAEQWAGGPGTDTNVVAFPRELGLGDGNVSVRIRDQERKFNINIAGAPILQQAFMLIGIGEEREEALDSILDWIDSDNDPKQHGAESDYYLRLQPPYFAKNGRIDDLTELLLVRRITPVMYRGFVDLFTAVSSRTLNINTASETTLQLLPPVDANVAAAIIQRRAGPDGIDATQDDTPFRNVQELSSVAGLPPPVMQQIQPYVGVRSVVFEVRVRAEIAGVVREFVAIVARNNPRNPLVLNFYAD